MSKKEKIAMPEYEAATDQEREVKEKITAKAWNLILYNTANFEIDDQMMKDFAGLLGAPIRGGHLQRQGKGVPGMKAILVDWLKEGNLVKLETSEALDVLIKVFAGQTVPLNPLAKNLTDVKNALAAVDIDNATNNIGDQKTLPVANNGGADTKEDGACLGRMKDVDPAVDDGAFYKMDHKFRGKALIFNNTKFRKLKLSERRGSKKDGKDLETVLGKLGFDVDVLPDYTLEQIQEKLEEASQDRDLNRDSDCLVVVALSHGDCESKIAAADTWYLDEELWEPFLAGRCNSLKGKPKLFFLNACRGENVDQGAEMDNNAQEQKVKRGKLPNHADFLIARSTVPGHVSWRNPENGSPFIQALCEVLDPENGVYEDDVVSLLVKAQAIVADKEMGSGGNKQMPSFTCQFTKKMKFTEKEGNPSS